MNSSGSGLDKDAACTCKARLPNVKKSPVRFARSFVVESRPV